MMNEKTNLPPAFGRWLKRLRAQHDLTQEKLAELAYCSVQTIRFFETGKRRPSLETAERLAEVLQVPDSQHEEFIRQARAATTATDSEREPAAAPADAQAASAPPPPMRLPAPSTALIGRQAERAVLCQLLGEQRRLLSLIGPGGIGKTRLALAVAHDLAGRFAGGAAFVALAAITNAGEIPAAIAQALIAPLPGASDPASQLNALLAGRSLLLVLDNFEQLLTADRAAEATALIDHILQYAEGIKLLITSRERLRLRGEHVFELTGLAVPPVSTPADATPSDAVLLFLERARQVAGDFEPTLASEATVAAICTLLEGIPLGIELAAAWVRTLTVEEIAAEISASIDFLALADRNAPARHRSLRAVFDHSWALLSTDERVVLARLAIFRGGFDRTAAREVAGASLPLLAALIDKSLVRTVSAADTVFRYDMHELLGQYLLDKVCEMGEADAVIRHHAEYFAKFAERMEPSLYAPESATWQRQVETEQGNLRAALQWSLVEAHDPLLGLRLAGSLGRFWYLSGRWKEGRDWLQRARAQTVDGGAARARVLVALGELYCLLGDQTQAQACLDEGLARWRTAQDSPNIAWALFQLGNLATMCGDYGQAEVYFSESLALYRTLDNAWGMATVLNQLGSLAITLADYPRAVALLDESLPIVRSLQRLGGVAVALNLLGRALLGEGDVARAISLFQEALDILRPRKNQAGMAWSLINLGLAEVQAHRPAQAAEHFRAALRIYQELESKSGLMAAFEGLAAVAAAQQSMTRAVHFLAVAERLREESGQVLTRFELEMSQRTRHTSEAGLERELWNRAWTSGLTLSLEQAIRLAFSEQMTD